MTRNHQVPKRKNPLLDILIILLGLLSIGALYGGGALMIAPDGSLLKIPVSYLGNSPFNGYFFPGLILFSVFGLFPQIGLVGLIKKPEWRICDMFNIFTDMHWAWSFCMYITVALIIWIQVQMILLQTVFWLQTFYMGYALVLLLILLLTPVRGSFRKGNIP